MKCPICEKGYLHYSVCDVCGSEQANAAQVHANKLMGENERLQAELTQARAEIERLKVLLTTAENDLIACYEEQAGASL